MQDIAELVRVANQDDFHASYRKGYQESRRAEARSSTELQWDFAVLYRTRVNQLCDAITKRAYEQDAKLFGLSLGRVMYFIMEDFSGIAVMDYYFTLEQVRDKLAEHELETDWFRRRVEKSAKDRDVIRRLDSSGRGRLEHFLRTF